MAMGGNTRNCSNFELAVLLQFLATMYSCFESAMSAIEITQGPQNVTVSEGESANFTCSYTGTNDFPTWYIGGASYVIQGPELGLPERHTYSNKAITVNDVQASDNGTTYRCSFLFGETTSLTATLIVIPGSQENVTESTRSVTTGWVAPIVTTSIATDGSSHISILATSFEGNEGIVGLHLGVSVAIGVAITSTCIVTTALSILMTWFIIRRGCNGSTSSPKQHDTVSSVHSTLELKVEPNTSIILQEKPRA